MKTAISLPDDTFARATRRAQELGISRSQFFATAAERYLAELDATSVTAQINAAIALSGHDDSDWVAAEHGRARLAEDLDENGDW